MLLHCPKVVRGDKIEYTVKEFTSARSTVEPEARGEKLEFMGTNVDDECPVVI